MSLSPATRTRLGFRTVLGLALSLVLTAGAVGLWVGNKFTQEGIMGGYYLVDKGDWECIASILLSENPNDPKSPVYRFCVDYRVKGLRFDGSSDSRLRINDLKQRPPLFSKQ